MQGKREPGFFDGSVVKNPPANAGEVNLRKTMRFTFALTLQNFIEKWQIPVLLKAEQGNFS